MTSIRTLVDAQDALVREAGLALPGQFTQCTYDLGPLRQPVYLCVTCGESRGVCGACSIACHGHHEQIELFPKRHFRCDCPTTCMPHPCTLKHPPQPLNVDNTYGQNFTGGGLFCRCASGYDVRVERETMVQCVACEDWFHESCLNLRERVAPRVVESGSEMKSASKAEPSGPKPEPQPPAHKSEHEPSTSTSNPIPKTEDPNDDDASSTTSDPDIPPALIQGDTYDALICGRCVLRNTTVRRYAGTVGVRMVLPCEGAWRVIGGEDGVGVGGEVDVGGAVKVEVGKVKTEGGATDVSEGQSAIGTKRRATETKDDPDPPTKRARPGQSVPGSNCLAPPINDEAQNVLDDLEKLDIKSEDAKPEGPGPRQRALGDVFLSPGWRERWCRCLACDPPLALHPYLLHEEDT
ncbi:hypothetical protein FRC08_017624, partial [Ceratobasidium sp. 394]